MVEFLSEALEASTRGNSQNLAHDGSNIKQTRLDKWVSIVGNRVEEIGLGGVLETP